MVDAGEEIRSRFGAEASCSTIDSRSSWLTHMKPSPASGTLPVSGRPPSTGGWAVAAVIAAVAALLYLPTVAFDFTLDDVHVVKENPVLQRAWWWDAIAGSYWPDQLTDGANNWRPLATLSWCFERWAAGGSEPLALRWHHASNVVLHGLAVLALFPIARRFCGSVQAAWVACALFAMHPAHTEVVPPLVGRTDLIAALGGFWMCAAFWRFRDTGGRHWLALSALAYAVGLGGKESAAPLVLLLPLADLLWHGRSWRELLGRAGLAYLPLLAVAVLYAFARISVLGEHTIVHAHAAPLAMIDRLSFAGRNTWVSAWLLALPVRFHHLLTTVPSNAPFTFPQPVGLMRGLWPLLALPLWLGWVPLLQRVPTAALLWVAVLLPWLPTSGLLPVAGGVSLRFLFISTGFAACAAVVGAQFVVRRHSSYLPALRVSALIWSVVALGITWRQIPNWRDNRTFFRAVLSEEPRCYTANYALGTSFALTGDLVEARKWFRLAIDVASDSPQSFRARENLAMTFEYGPSGRRFGPDAPLARALALYHDALRVKPDALIANLAAATVSSRLAERSGLTAVERQAYQSHAFEQLVRTIESHPDHPSAYLWHRRAAGIAIALGDNRLARRELAATAAGRAARKQWVLDHEGRLEWSRETQRAIGELEEALWLMPPPDEEATLRAALEVWRER